ncbi:Uncharacterised protein [Mycobacteroides abscessus subsp. abscessus]|nr:Uncharacterised protein [Mycobacteroides abscessus subsp. abscessus]
MSGRRGDPEGVAYFRDSQLPSLGEHQHEPQRPPGGLRRLHSIIFPHSGKYPPARRRCDGHGFRCAGTQE